MKSAKLTDAQAAYLQDPRTGSPRGLVRKGCLYYRWGNNPSFGYVVSDLGKQMLAAYLAERERGQ